MKKSEKSWWKVGGSGSWWKYGTYRCNKRDVFVKVVYEVR